MCEVIAIVNQKGGCAKTTTAVNLGVGLALTGKKVALIDADPQGSLTVSLGYREPDQQRLTLATLMTSIINGEETDSAEGILHHEEDVDLIPADITLAGLEVSLSNVMSREMILKDYIELLRDQYDYILIDCMPSLGILTINSLVSADSLIIPVQAAYLPVVGLQQLMQTVSMVRKRLNRNLQILGILITMADYRTNCARDIAAKLKEAYAESIGIFETSIPASVRLVEASAEGESIFVHDPAGKAAQAYQKLTEEVLLR